MESTVNMKAMKSTATIVGSGVLVGFLLSSMVWLPSEVLFYIFVFCFSFMLFSLVRLIYLFEKNRIEQLERIAERLNK